MAETPMGNAIEFMEALGVYEVILPFLLVFTLMFALLEKTKVLGMEKVTVDGETHQVTRKNLNSMIALVTGFFVVGSGQLVSVINEIMARMMVFLVIFFLFALTVGAFRKQTEEGMALDEPWIIFFSVSAFISLLFLFLDAIDVLQDVFEFVANYYQNDVFMSLVLVALLAGAVWLITKSPNHAGGDDEE